MAGKDKKPEIRFTGFTESWEQSKLIELGEVITGSTPSTQVEAYYSDNGMPWVTPTDISDNVTYRTAKHLSEEGQKIARVAPRNTVLVTCIASIGKNTMLGTAGSFNQQINGLVPYEKENYPYFLFTESALWSKKMKRSAAAGTMQIVNKTEFSELVTYVPTLDEQIQIGVFFNYLDNLITLQQRKYDKLVIIKKSMFEKMFPKDGAKVPEIRFAGFTDDWEQRSLGEDITLRGGATPSKANPEYWNGPILWLSSQEIKKRYVSKGTHTITNKAVEDNTTRIVKAGTPLIVSRSGILVRLFPISIPTVDVAINQDIKALIFDENIINSSFLVAQLQKNTTFILKTIVKTGTTVQSINMPDFIKLQLFYPEKKEQEKIGIFFERLDDSIALHQRKLEKLKNIKESMLEKMFV